MTETNQAPPRRLTRSATDRVLAGVCGGLADHTGLDPVIFRVVFAVAALMGGAGLAAYLIAWLVIPPADGGSHVEAVLGTRRLPRAALVVVGVLVLVGLVNIDIGRFHGNGGGLPLLILLGVGVWLWSRRHEEQRTAMPIQASIEDEPRPKRSKLGRVTSSVALVVAGVLAAVQADAATAFAVLLVVVGGGLLVGAAFGRARWLIGLGLVLAVAAAIASVADVPFRGGVGDRTWRPTTPAELRGSYRLGAGEAELDLRAVDLSRDRTVHVSVGMGELRVLLPDGVDLAVDAHAGFGEVIVFGDDDNGVDVTRQAHLEGGDAQLVLDARVGMGHVEVTR